MLFTEGQQHFKKYMIYHEMSPETVKGYMKDLRCFNQFITDRYNGLVYVEDITVEDVEEYMYYLVDERELAPRSRNRYLFSLRSFFNYAVKKTMGGTKCSCGSGSSKSDGGKKGSFNKR